MAVELMPLCTLHVQLKPPIEVGAGPAGRRLIVEVASAHVHGERLRGEMVGLRPRTGCASALRALDRLTSGRRSAPMTARSSSRSTTVG